MKIVNFWNNQSPLQDKKNKFFKSNVKIIIISTCILNFTDLCVKFTDWGENFTY